MSKREENNLIKVIDDYAQEKSKYDILGKEVDSKKAFIKNKITEMGADVYSTSKYVAKISYSERVSMDDEKVIEIIKENIPVSKRKNVIKTKEYVDYDVLENLIYNGEMSADKLEPAQSVKVIASLTVKPIKKEKDEDD